jgi:hypothetical protein
VSDEVPDRPATGPLLEALHVRRNAAAGLLAGAALAVGAYLFRVFELVGPFAGTRAFPLLGPEGWFLMLAFVLATAAGLLVATLLTLVSAYRLVRGQ